MFLSDLTEFRSLPAIADVPFRDKFRQIRQPKLKEKAVFFAGCLIDFAYTGTGEAVVRILNKAGIERSCSLMSRPAAELRRVIAALMRLQRKMPWTT